MNATKHKMNENNNENTASATIIGRRDINPLLAKACQLIGFYEKALGCTAVVLDGTGSYMDPSDDNKPPSICELCRNQCQKSRQCLEEDEYPCTKMHEEAQFRAKKGNSSIYVCKKGLGYWISPIFAGSWYAGSMVAGRVLTVPKDKFIEEFHSSCGISSDELSRLFTEIPEKNQEEIQAMARLLYLCGGKLSANFKENSHISKRKNIIKKNAGARRIENENKQDYRLLFQDKERTLIAALRRGDKGTASVNIGELLEIIQKTGAADFDFLKYKSIELTVILSRQAEEHFNTEEAYDRCFKRLLDSEKVEELSENLQYIIEYMSGKIFSFRGVCHASALRKAERFIWDNYTRKINLKEIAAASGLSAPYFSTIFKDEMGQNLSDYLNRLRVEKAAGILTGTNISLTSIAKVCGFEDQSWFSKVFKSQMGVSPGKFRDQGKK